MGNIIGMASAAAGLDNRYALLEHRHAEYLGHSGGALSGPLQLAGPPTAADHAASKQYVDERLSKAVSGGAVLPASPALLKGDGLGGAVEAAAGVDFAAADHSHGEYAPLAHQHNYAAPGHTHQVGDISNFPAALPPTLHTQGAETILPGTLGGCISANTQAVQALATPQLRNISIGTEDLSIGNSPLPCGDLYFVYEV